jgi:hypothetical protein
MALRCFSSEFRAFSMLRELQGRQIPRCSKPFVVSFPSRELEEDQEVCGLVLEFLDAQKLDKKGHALKYTPDERIRIRKNILDIVKRVYQHGVVFNCVCADNFLVVSKDNTPRMIVFSGTCDPDEEKLSDEEMMWETDVALDDVKDMLDDLGFI